MLCRHPSAVNPNEIFIALSDNQWKVYHHDTDSIYAGFIDLYSGV